MGVRVLAETIGENPLVAGVVVGDAQAAKRAQEAKRMARKKNRHRIARANAEARHAIALAQAYLAERE
jgi:DNA gyrase/topoisomerase IV subunit B